MTVSEYKKLVPEHAHLEGDVLWDAMTQYWLDHPEKFSFWYEDTPLAVRTKDMPYSHMGALVPEPESRRSPLFYRRWKMHKLNGKLPTTMGSAPFKVMGKDGNYTIFEPWKQKAKIASRCLSWPPRKKLNRIATRGRLLGYCLLPCVVKMSRTST